MRKLVKILVFGLVLLAGVATTATLTLSDSNNTNAIQMACEGCGNEVEGGGG